MEVERQHIFFDLDGTLTDSRTEITPEMTHLLFSLLERADVAVISGATRSQMEQQIPWMLTRDVYVMPQSGNETYFRAKTFWQNVLTEETLAPIRSHIDVVRKSDTYREIISPYTIDEDDIVQFRGGQVSFSMIGHNAPLSIKMSFDPDAAKRSALLREFPLVSDVAEVHIGGTTNFDYTKKGWNKAGNTTRLIKKLGWNIERCIYVGDRLHEGGNDYVMVPIMKCESVRDPRDTAKFIERILHG